MNNPLDILIVEDEAFEREMLGAILRKQGYRVAEADTGETAVGILETGFFDLILPDYKKPGLSGLDVLKQAKALNPEMDAVMVTAYGTIETAVDGMKAGACDYITKPIDLEEFCILIDWFTEHRALVRENEILRQDIQAKEPAVKTIHNQVVESLEKQMIRHGIGQTDFSQSQAAAILGLSERMLRYKLIKMRTTEKRQITPQTSSLRKILTCMTMTVRCLTN